MLAGLASLHCSGGEGAADTSKAKQVEASQSARPAATPAPQIELVKVELTELRPTTDLIVELVGGQVRLISPNHTGQLLDFGRRDPDNQHLRVELLAEAKERFADAVASSERREVRLRIDAATVASDLVDLAYTMGQIGVLGYQLEIATSQGPHVLTLNMAQACSGEPSPRRCVNLHLRVTEQGTLVSAQELDPNTWCDIPLEHSENLESIAGRAITPAGGGCPGWPRFGPGDEGLDQVLATFQEFGTVCRTSEISVEDNVTAASFIPTIAALRAVKQHVVFRAGARASCTEGPYGPISIDALVQQ